MRFNSAFKGLTYGFRKKKRITRSVEQLPASKKQCNLWAWSVVCSCQNSKKTYIDTIIKIRTLTDTEQLGSSGNTYEGHSEGDRLGYLPGR